jgi:hypothetical protein
MYNTEIFDNHVHGGDIGRIEDIQEYIQSMSPKGLSLLSLPLKGCPGFKINPATWNAEVLFTKIHTDAPDFHVPEVFGEITVEP